MQTRGDSSGLCSVKETTPHILLMVTSTCVPKISASWREFRESNRNKHVIVGYKESSNEIHWFS